MSVNSLPAQLAKIVGEFREAEGREKLEMLLQYSENLEPIPQGAGHITLAPEAVPECMTPVSIAMGKNGSRLRFYFQVPEDSPTVRGYAAILAEGLNGSTAEAILQIPADFYMEMGLQEVLTPQRMNGMAAIVAHIKRLALENR